MEVLIVKSSINSINGGFFSKPLFEYRRVIAINGGRYYPGKIL
jgi:hypothetical protein